jgi:hypothetical protein
MKIVTEDVAYYFAECIDKDVDFTSGWYVRHNYRNIDTEDKSLVMAFYDVSSEKEAKALVNVIERSMLSWISYE